MTNRPTAIITGAASGIGLAIATLLSHEGYESHLFDVDEEKLSSEASRLSGTRAFAGSVAKPDDVQRLADQVGAVDLLCLNAGVISTSSGPPWSAPPEEWDRVLGVNLLGVVNGLRSFVPLMLDRASPSHILITASLAGAATWPGGGPYAASKHAVLAVAEQAALELQDSHIGVTALCPALVETAMSDVGEDPNHVAARAIEAVRAKQFAVVPIDWSTTIEQRAAMLTSGDQPATPTPG